MKSKLLKIALPLAFWLLVWTIGSLIINNSFLFPSIIETANALSKLITTPKFYTAVAISFIRVAVGLILGCCCGIIFALLCKKYKVVNYIFSPIVTVIRSTPVASFIILLWVLMNGNTLTIFIAFIMVMPLIWQSSLDGLDAIDNNLLEVARIFEFSRLKTIRLLTIPTLKKFLIPAIINSVGLAWKAEIAAEIIAYTINSIGQGINDAKYLMDTPTVFAWTVVIIILSILLETITKLLLRRHKNES